MTTDRKELIIRYKELKGKIKEISIYIAEMLVEIKNNQNFLDSLTALENKYENELFGEE